MTVFAYMYISAIHLYECMHLHTIVVHTSTYTSKIENTNSVVSLQMAWSLIIRINFEMQSRKQYFVITKDPPKNV